MPDGDGLQRSEAIQRLESLFTAVAAGLDAAERQFNPAAGAVIVDEDLAGAHRARHAHLARQ